MFVRVIYVSTNVICALASAAFVVRATKQSCVGSAGARYATTYLDVKRSGLVRPYHLSADDVWSTGALDPIMSGSSAADGGEKAGTIVPELDAASV